MLTNNTLEVYQKENLIFHSKSRWLAPLFELEEFLNKKKNSKDNLKIVDKIIGVGAAILIVKNDYDNIYTNLITKNALLILNKHTKKIEYKKLISALECEQNYSIENLNILKEFKKLKKRYDDEYCIS